MQLWLELNNMLHSSICPFMMIKAANTKATSPPAKQSQWSFVPTVWNNPIFTEKVHIKKQRGRDTNTTDFYEGVWNFSLSLIFKMLLSVWVQAPKLLGLGWAKMMVAVTMHLFYVSFFNIFHVKNNFLDYHSHWVPPCLKWWELCTFCKRFFFFTRS